MGIFNAGSTGRLGHELFYEIKTIADLSEPQNRQGLFAQDSRMVVDTVLAPHQTTRKWTSKTGPLILARNNSVDSLCDGARRLRFAVNHI
jgi:hypothetical protein